LQLLDPQPLQLQYSRLLEPQRHPKLQQHLQLLDLAQPQLMHLQLT
jgi:hypothetical protein